MSDLTPNESYIFAVGAYDKRGELIGDSIGETSSPIVACHSFSILYNWSLLCQVAYQANEFGTALSAFEQLWRHFIYEDNNEIENSIIDTNQTDFQMKFHR